MLLVGSLLTLFFFKRTCFTIHTRFADTTEINSSNLSYVDDRKGRPRSEIVANLRANTQKCDLFAFIFKRSTAISLRWNM